MSIIRLSSLSSLHNHVKSRIRFNCHDGVYEGVLSRFFEANHLVTLTEASKDGKLVGTISLFSEEIKDWQMLEKNTEFLKASSEGAAKLKQREEPVVIAALDDDCEVLVDQAHELFQAGEDVTVFDVDQDDTKVWRLKSTRNLLQKVSEEVFLLKEIDDVFHRTLDVIKDKKSIGFALFGNRVGRFGRVDLLVFAIEEGIFAFPGNPQIVSLLKPLLEDSSIEKVIHTSHVVADALQRLFGVRIEKVFDTQVYDYYLQKDSYERLLRDCPRQLPPARPQCGFRSLDQCMRGYLNVTILRDENSGYFKDHLTNREVNILRSRTILLRELACLLSFLVVEDAAVSSRNALRTLRHAEGKEYEVLRRKPDDPCYLRGELIADERFDGKFIKLCEQMKIEFNKLQVQAPSRVD